MSHTDPDMDLIENTRPLDVLASRVWSGTHWHYHYIEKMCAELTRLRALALRAKELERVVLEYNCILRSTHSVALRQGADTNWQAFERRVHDILSRNHEAVRPIIAAELAATTTPEAQQAPTPEAKP